MEDFFSAYISYIGRTEVPAIYNRWAAITGLGALLGRQYTFDHGHFHIVPNIYCMLIGSAGTRKGTTIKLMRKLLEGAGYEAFAAERTSKEKFLMDLAGESTELESPESLLDQNLFGETSARSDCEMFIAIDEFNDFIGTNNIEFISMLGNMWDYNGLYKNRIKTGKSVEIYNPTVSIIGGNTPTGFSIAFPVESLGQGFFSRLMLIYGEANGERITFPVRPSAAATATITERIREIKRRVVGAAKLGTGAETLFDKIYKSDFKVEDVRFGAYSNRRFTHLLKLTLLTSAARGSSCIEPIDIIYANTILVFAERLMPKALGEFGKAKHADVSHKIIQLAESTHQILTMKMIWKHVNNDLEKMADLGTLLQNLVQAEKLQVVEGNRGFLPRRSVQNNSVTDMVDFSMLTAEEQRMIA